jgi:formate hydrogenlyase subunit 3/multisubunit Na+/H+ antiporter MnhD subunit
LYPLTPENLDLIRNTIVFLALGFGLLLAVVPLSLWFGPLADEMPLVSLAFLVGIAQPVGLWLLYQQMVSVPWLVTKSPLLEILYWGGIITVPVGALLALGERRSGRWLAYLSLVSLGNALIGLSLGTQLGLIGAVFAIFNRAAGVTLIAGGLSFAQHHAERGWQMIGAAAIVAGGFSLGGIPPLVGFASRYSIYRDLAGTNPNAIIVLSISAALVLLAVTQVAWDILKSNRANQVSSHEIKMVPYLCAVVVLLLMIVTIVIGLFPQLIGNSLIDTLGRAAYLK